MKRRILALCLVLALCLGLLPVSAAAAARSGTCGKNLTWTLDSSGTLTISGTGPMDNYTLTDSEAYEEGETLDTPWPGWDVRAVVIRNGVTSIGTYAFIGTRAARCTIPGSVTTIGDNAFNSTPLSELTIADGLKTIGSYAFWGCDDLTSVSLPGSVTTIGDHAFEQCQGLEELTLSEGLREIGPYAFRICNALKRVDIPDSVTTVGYAAFNNCQELREAVLGSGVKAVGDWAFAWCYELNTLTLSDSLETVGENAFALCGKLHSPLVFPETIQSVGREAFEGCDVPVVSFPDVTHPVTIGGSAFSRCPILRLRLGAGITEIGVDAFYGAQALSAALPGTMTALENCLPHSVKELYLPASVTRIGDGGLRISDLDDLYYGGTEAQWQALEEEYGTHEDYLYDGQIFYSRPKIHYNCYSPYAYLRIDDGYYIVPMDFGDLTINNTGTATAYFRVEDWNKNPCPGVKLSYQIEDYAPVEKSTDENGLLAVPLPVEGAKKGAYTFAVTFSAPAGDKAVFDDGHHVTVTVEKLSYAQTLSGALSATGEFGGGIGTEADAAVVEAKAHLLNGFLRLGLGGVIQVSDQYENGVRTMTVTHESSLSGGAGLESGLEVLTVGNNSIAPLRGELSGSVGSTVRYGVTLKNYDPGNTKQLRQIGGVLCAGFFSSASVFLRALIQGLDLVDCNNYAEGRSATLDRELKAFDAEYGIWKGALANLGRTTVWTLEELMDSADPAGTTDTITKSMVTSTGGGLYSGMSLGARGSGASYSVGSGEYVLGRTLSNHKEVSVIRDGRGDVTGACYKTYDGDETDVLWGKTSTDTYATVTFRGDGARAFVSMDMELNRLAQGNIFASIQDSIDALTCSGLTGRAEETVKIKNGVKVKLPIGLQAAAKVKITPAFSGESSYSWKDKTSAVYRGKEYVLTRSGVTRDQVAGKLHTPLELLTEPVAAVLNGLANSLGTVTGKLSGGVASGAFRVSAASSAWYCAVSSLRDGLAALESEAAPVLMDEDTETAAVSAAVGQPCQVAVFTDGTCTEAVDDEALAEAARTGKPVLLTIGYTDEMLEAAGVELWDDQVLPEVMLCRFDPERNLYVRADSTEDRAAKTVTGAVTAAGEYILMVDALPPEVTDVSQDTETLTPSFTVTFRDLSGVASLRLWLERERETGGDWAREKVGEDLVTPETFAQYYTPAAGQLRYTFAEPLEPDTEYLLCCRAADSLGNETAEEDLVLAWFSVRSDGAALGSLTVPAGKITSPEPFAVTLPFSDGVENVTLLLSADGEPLESVQMEEDWEQDAWTARLTPVPGVSSLTLTAVGFDRFGNELTAPPATVALEVPVTRGLLGEAGELIWNYDRDARQVTVTTPRGGEDPGLNGDRPVLAASYSREGRLLSAAAVTAPGGTAPVDRNAVLLKLIWLDAGGAPLCRHEELRVP